MIHTFLGRFMAVGLGSVLSASLWALPTVAEAPSETDDGLRQGLPGRRIGGGTRPGQASAYEMHKPLVALIPQSNLGITTAAYPTLLFHLPVFEREQQVEFVLYNSADELVYDETFTVVGQSGIVDVNLAESDNLPPLALGETYQWYFLIVADDRSQDIVVDGWIQRVDLEAWRQRQNLTADFSSRLAAAAPLQQARLLSQEAGLLHDAVLAVYQFRQANPENATAATDWAQLLQAIGLGEIGAEPIAAASLVPAVRDPFQ